MSTEHIRKLEETYKRREDLRIAGLLAMESYGPKGRSPAKARYIIQVAPDWELYLDSIDWGSKYTWTDDKSRAWSWSAMSDKEPEARLALVRQKYPHAFLTLR